MKHNHENDKSHEYIAVSNGMISFINTIDNPSNVVDNDKIDLS